MALRDWPVRRMQRLWLGMAAVYGVLFVAGPVRNYFDRRTAERQQAEQDSRADSAWAALTPAQRAHADSLKDSLRAALRPLRRAFDSVTASPQFAHTVSSIGHQLERAIIVGLVILFTPAFVLLVLTVTWWSARRRVRVEIGA